MQQTDHAASRNGTSNDAPHGSGQQSNGEAVSVYEWVADTARNNPVLVVGGAAAIGAIAVLALTRRAPPPSNVKLLERSLRRQLASAEETLKRSVKDLRRADIGAGLSELPGAVASHLGNLDTSQLEALAHRARRMIDQVSQRISAAVR